MARGYGSPEIAACRNQKAAVQWHGYQILGSRAAESRPASHLIGGMDLAMVPANMV